MGTPFSTLKRSLESILREADEHAETTLALHADLPIEQVATLAVKTLEDTLRANLTELLLMGDFVKRIRVARRKQSPPKQPSLPGFEHLPSRIRGERGEVKPIQFVTYRDMERYVKLLGNRFRNTAKYKEAVRLRDILKRRKDGTTVGDIF